MWGASSYEFNEMLVQLLISELTFQHQVWRSDSFPQGISFENHSVRRADVHVGFIGNPLPLPPRSVIRESVRIWLTIHVTLLQHVRS